jgi:predicted DCC family thiol-disulfide oxidoreductase YuxK
MPDPIAPSRSGNSSLLDTLALRWTQIWFESRPTTAIEITRIGLGLAMLLNYGLASPYILTLWGDEGWLPRSLLSEVVDDPLMQSVLYYFTAPWQQVAFHVLFVGACAALAVGWRTSWAKWLVLIGHVSYTYRNPAITYGFDSITASLLVILCFAPVGRALSLDRVREVRRAKRANLMAHPPLPESAWSAACIRLMQLQMAVLFFISGVEKLRGEEWWEGDAIWRVFVHTDYYNGTWLLDLLANHFWLVNVATYGTILIELAYPFLIWQRETRPYLLAAAIFLHLQFGLLMGLYFFSFVMIMGHMSFLRQEWLTALGRWWRRRTGPMEMIYDGRCGFCVRSMAWFLAFDGLGQIAVRDFRKDPSPVVSDEKMEKALFLVLPGGRALPGFEAYRYVVLRVPGLWWQVPLFYIPVLSRLIGHPIYNWIAANRSRMPF